MFHNNLYENATFQLKTQNELIGEAQKEAYMQSASVPSKRTTNPINTGTSVIGIKYADGVMLASDMLVSYGSLARFRDIQRIKKIGNYTLLGASGEYSDFQDMQVLLDELLTEDFCHDDGHTLSPKEIHSYMSRVMYNRRNQFNFYYNQLVIGGYKNGASFLGFVDLVGTSFEENHVATGFGAHLAIPLLRKAWRPDLTKDEAKKLLDDCLRVLFYRDARALNKIQIATATVAGLEISEPYTLETYWNYGTGPDQHIEQ